MRWSVLVLAACHHIDPAIAPDSSTPPDSASPPTVTVEPITDHHRAVAGAMFGGWGPHLGHLIHGEQTLWVDDLCDPNVTGDCDVNVDRRVGVFEKQNGAWTQRATIPLTGVQQNTAAIEVAGAIYVYGVAGSNIVECTETGGCNTISIDIGPAANYIGAAVAPNGSRVVWWTNVVDGGGGSFGYLVNYGGGWNGPRTGAIGGYNDCGYAHVAFDGTTARWFCQVVTGYAPNWTFSTLVGTSDALLTTPVGWVNGLAPPAGDSIMSTNDLYGAHLLARSQHGDAVYYYASGAGYTEALAIHDVYRARWIAATDTIALAHDTNAHTAIEIQTAPRAALAPGAFDLASWPATSVPLPANFGTIYAIYPVAPAYQDATIPDVEFAIVGSGDEHAAYHVSWHAGAR